jgi:hypothetical protein
MSEVLDCNSDGWSRVRWPLGKLCIPWMLDGVLGRRRSNLDSGPFLRSNNLETVFGQHLEFGCDV